MSIARLEQLVTIDAIGITEDFTNILSFKGMLYILNK